MLLLLRRLFNQIFAFHSLYMQELSKHTWHTGSSHQQTLNNGLKWPVFGTYAPATLSKKHWMIFISWQ